MYKSQFQEIGPYDWFCGPGSHFLLFYNKTQTFLIPSPDRFHFLKCLLPMCSEPDSGRGVFWACAWWSNHLVNPNVCCDWPRPFTRASQRVCMLMSRRIRDATEGDKKRCSINPSFESSRGIKKVLLSYQFFPEVGRVFGYIPRYCQVSQPKSRSLFSRISSFPATRQSPSVPSARQDGGHHWTFTERNWTTRRDLNAFAGTLLARVLQTRLQFAGSGSWGERGGRVFWVTQSGRAHTHRTGKLCRQNWSCVAKPRKIADYMDSTVWYPVWFISVV